MRVPRCVAATVALCLMLLSGGQGRAVAPLAMVSLKGAPGVVGKPVPLVAHNALGRPVRLERAVRVQRWDGKRWRTLAATTLLLRASCKPPAAGKPPATGKPATGKPAAGKPPAAGKSVRPRSFARGCVSLPPRRDFRSRPWLGTVGHAQCICERCRPVGPGLYRYVGTACAGERVRVVSLPFRLKAP